MKYFTGLTSNETFTLLSTSLTDGRSIKEVADSFTPNQLGEFIDRLYFLKTTKDTASIDRSLSKSLCCFLYELNHVGAAHYSSIRLVVKEKYNLMVNDYSTLRFWRLIEKTEQNGVWRITERGKRFLNGTLELASTLTIKNGMIEGVSDERVTIADYPYFNILSYESEISRSIKALNKFLDEK